MLFAYFHPRRRDNPQACVKVDFLPLSPERLTSRVAVRMQNSSARAAMASRLRKSAMKSWHFDIGQRRMMASREPLPLG